MDYLRKLTPIACAKLVGRNHLNRRIMKRTTFIVFGLLAVWGGPTFGGSDGQSIDSTRSTMTIYVYKTGILSTLVHNHEIEAPIESGEVKGSENSSVELRIDVSKLRVVDAEVSEDTRAKIQATMQGTEVLDVVRFPEIYFQSTRVEPNGAEHWVIQGNLDLHGQSHPISFEVTLKNGLYKGTVVLKQSAFGISPVRIAGGAVKLKDELKIAFSIALLN